MLCHNSSKPETQPKDLLTTLSSFHDFLPSFQEYVGILT